MYIPPHFAQHDRDALFDLIEAHSFGALVTAPDGVPFATHLPFLLDREREVLRGHMARANPQWQSFASGVSESLVVFQGPHAYISPSWYETRLSVPTWNYTVVHVYGVPRLLTDAGALLQLLTDLVHQHESPLAEQWSMDVLPADYVDGMAQAIVGFEIPIARLEGKWKLSQNRASGDVVGAAAGLAEQADAGSQDVAALMRSMG